MKNCKIIVICFLFLAFLACQDDNQPEPQINLIQNVKALDNGNNHDGSDLVVLFNIEDDASEVSEIKVALVKEDQFSNFDISQAENISSSSYESVSVSGSDYEVTFSNTLKDASNNDLEKDLLYRVVFILTMNGNTIIDEETEAFTFTDGHYLDGRYTGLWNDNIYANFAISAELKFERGMVSGPFYYSGSFSSCCGGENDGFIFFDLENNAILDFKYNQDLITYMNGCPGKYTGDGQLVRYLQLDINFTGDDCDGHHTGGKIELNKI